MKIEFRTIEIEKVVLSYIGMFVAFLAIHFLFGLTVKYWLLLIAPVPIYMIFRGKLAVSISNDRLSLQWIKKPFLCSVRAQDIYFSEIIRWKYQKGYRGPDEFSIILESGKKIKLRPCIWNYKDLETHLVKKFGESIKEYYAETPKEFLVQKIKASAYVDSLTHKIYRTKIGMLFFAFAALLILLLGLLVDSAAEADLTWILFLSFFFIFLSISIRFNYLKSERRDTLRVD